MKSHCRAFPVLMLPGWLCFAMLSPAGQPAAKPDILKGEALASVHPYKMQKGTIYRIVATGNGFTPQVRVKGQTGSGYLPPPPAGRFAGNVAQTMFIPRETKVYQITVGFLPGSDIKKGANSYTLTIERARLQPQLPEQERRFELAENSKKLEQGKTYSITVTGRGFAPQLEVLDGRRPVARAGNGRWYGFGPDAEFITTLTMSPARTTEYRIIVSVGPVTEKRLAPLTYTTRVAEIKPELSAKGQLSGKDPIYPRRGGPHKIHRVKLEAGKTDQIDLSSLTFDPYLFLEDAAGKLLAQDDDSGGNLNARMIFRPEKTAVYSIVATTFDPGVGRDPGPYGLTVMENADAQPSFAAPPGSAIGNDIQNFPNQ